MPSFSKTLEDAIHAALAIANSRRHELATLEHLLLEHLVGRRGCARVLELGAYLADAAIELALDDDVVVDDGDDSVVVGDLGRGAGGGQSDGERDGDTGKLGVHSGIEPRVF